MRSQPLIDMALADCTEAQRNAIRHVDGPLLVLAGPGSGKTRVITRRIAHLVGTGCPPQAILAITFTNKAAGEMRERVATLGAASGAWIFTFHAFCARVLRTYGKHVDLKPSFSIFDSSDTLSAVKTAIARLSIDKALYKPAKMAQAISHAKNQLREPEEVAKSRRPDAETVARIYRKYTEILRSNNAADFDDLLMLVVKLMSTTPKVAEKLRRRFRHLLIDEYQDTNHAQYLIAKHLATSHRNICATGDPDQSIYGWRGADIRNILDFEKDYSDAKVVRLEQNYRSTKKILAVADKLIAHNLHRKEKTLWTENPEGEPLRVLRCEDDRAEADQVVAEVKRLCATGEFTYRDVAVFYRTNAQSRTLEAAFMAESIPYTIVAGTAFYQRKEIKDLLAYLRLVVNPVDDVSAERVANVPPRRLGDTSLRRMKAWGAEHGASLTETMARASEAGVRGPALQASKSLLKVLAELRAMPQTPVAPILEKLMKTTRYEDYLNASFENGDERIDNVRELVSAAAEFNEAEPEGNLRGFLEQAALVSDTDRWDKEQGSATFMTLHAAKGLEFPVVFIVGLEDGLLPLTRDEVVHDLEEERRLLFVGITRAMKHAALTYAESRMQYGKHGYTEPSRFLSELPEEVEEEWTGEGLDFRFGMSRGGKGSFKIGGARKKRGAVRRVKRGKNEEIVYDGEVPEEDYLQNREAPFKPGDSVIHSSYGRGTVLAVRGHGPTAMAEVRFPIQGVKKLMLQYARLRKA